MTSGPEAAAWLISSADIRGPLDRGRLRRALDHLALGHPALRTVFVRARQGPALPRVLARHRPLLVDLPLPPLPGGDPVGTVHALVAASAPSLLLPFRRPPAVFVAAAAGPQRTVLALLVHPAVADTRSLGPLWRSLAAAYADGSAPPSPAAPPAHDPGESARALRRRARDLAGWPRTAEIAADTQRSSERTPERARLLLGLGPQARAACEQTRLRHRLPRAAVLLSAWALVVGRRAAADRLLMGLLPAARPGTAAPGERVLPVRCDLAGGGTLARYLAGTARDMAAAQECAAAPSDGLAAALAPSLVPFAYDAHEHVLPPELHTADLTLRLHEGPRAGIAEDAVLRLLRWGPVPELALDYAPSALRLDDVTALACGLEHTLGRFGADPGTPLSEVRTFTAAQRERLLATGTGPRPPAHADPWQLVERAARARPETVAVRDADPARGLTYRGLRAAVQAQAAALAAAGTVPGDRVGIAVRRSVREVVAVLAVLRLGAAYVSLEPDTPPAVARRMLDLAGVRVVLGDARRLAALGGVLDGRTALPLPEAPGGPAPDAAAGTGRRPAAVDGGATACVVFVPGPAGEPRRVDVPRSTAVRLARDPDLVRAQARGRFVRAAPLGTETALPEILTPLLAGGTLDVLPTGPADPDVLAAFLKERRATGLWLDADTFRRAADYCPGAFAGAAQVLVRHGEVPPGKVARVLTACPGLRVSLVHTPAGTAAPAAVCHLDDLADLTDPLPAGRPLPGTTALVLDGDGRLAPPGAFGELHLYDGSGASGPLPGTRRTPDCPHPLYPTGEAARWDATGRLRVARSADEVTVQGVRVRLPAVAAALREHPEVADAVVVRAPGGELLAGVVAPDDPSLPEELRVHTARYVPSRSVPALWALVAAVPLLPDGTPDAAELLRAATRADAVGRPARGSAAGPERGAPRPDASGARPADVETVVRSAWQEALGAAAFGRDDVFFDVGGTSMRMLTLRASLHRRLPGCGVTVQDLYRHPTVARLADHLRGGDAGRQEEPE